MRRRRPINREKVDRIIKEAKERQKQKKTRSIPAIKVFPAPMPITKRTIQLGKIKFSPKEVISMSQISCRTLCDEIRTYEQYHPELRFPSRVQYDNLDIEVIISHAKCMRLFKLFKQNKLLNIEILIQQGPIINKAQAEGRLYSISECDISEGINDETRRKVTFSFQPNIITIL